MAFDARKRAGGTPYGGVCVFNLSDLPSPKFGSVFGRRKLGLKQMAAAVREHQR